MRIRVKAGRHLLFLLTAGAVLLAILV